MAICIRLLAIGAACAALAACGGGGDGGATADVAEEPSALTGEFTADNFAVQSDRIAAALNTVTVSSNPFKQTLGSELTAPCVVGGTQTLKAEVAGDALRVAGETLTRSFDGCDNGGGVLAGTVVDTVMSYSQTGSVAQGAWQTRFNQFGSSRIQLDGLATSDVHFDSVAGDERLSQHYDGVVMTGILGAITLNHTVHQTLTPHGSASLSFSGELAVDGKSYRFTQDSPFLLSTTTGYPTQGLLSVTDAKGARVDALAGADAFTYRYFVPDNESGEPDATATGAPYAD